MDWKKLDPLSNWMLWTLGAGVSSWAVFISKEPIDHKTALEEKLHFSGQRYL